MSFDADAVGHLLHRVPGRYLCQLVATRNTAGTDRIDDG